MYYLFLLTAYINNHSIEILYITITLCYFMEKHFYSFAKIGNFILVCQLKSFKLITYKINVRMTKSGYSNPYVKQ